MSDQHEREDNTPLSSWCSELKNNLDNKDALSDGTDDDTPLSSWCGELNNGSDNKDALSAGAGDEDWELIGDISSLETGEAGGKLQYRVKWVRYSDDPKWYNAANFKNSPHKLYDFHEANLARPGPPQRLNY
ncbi:hypothetical protein K458DRAFT_383455 [Lentithecium fluviatile CBS 122367]|uniref:Chromo domain-containing protein n=1 Tax=Lentithecium fluviatile CBS 122367 TaxID=1168545 RepID=A0A6G1JIT2_9PLEO|nr:hypothetical protein K458DRAFT_383455 [Lentithecium fluviatile CBS 122367]